MGQSRYTRPELERDQPFRHFTTIMSGVQAATREKVESEPNFIEKGVSSAYDVIDRYIQQGQEFARTMGRGGPPPPGMPGMDGEGLSGMLGAANAQYGDVQARAIKTYMDLISNWFELIGMSTQFVAQDYQRMLGQNGATATAPPPSQQSYGNGVQEHSGSIMQTDDLVYEIASPRPVRVSAKLNTAAYAADLRSHGLRSLDGDGAAIEVGFETDHQAEVLIVRIHVGPDLPPGTYTGLAMDAASEEILGTLRLELS